ncbi:DUF4829 domain-containing protein [Clostridium vincentii]|uniref:DUF4829 domain-containing protein n=1 Tax=Clostridium vincentii TaxID=52704 RepID=A0A2T0BHT4_9CLOT|nr:DUF4829 domain-containing protein [Clostridium vincentii]PRR83450.1 hypothetical protein CLVI_09990 [Clostridium vincentii]
MRHIKIKAIVLVVIIAIITIFSYSYYKKVNLTPKEVIEKNCDAYNSKNLIKLKSTWSNRLSGGVLIFDDSVNIEIYSIEEDFKLKDGYMEYGRGSINGISKDNVKAYKVIYEEVSNTIDTNSEKLWKDIILIKKGNRSPWLIDDIGV